MLARCWLVRPLSCFHPIVKLQFVVKNKLCDIYTESNNLLCFFLAFLYMLSTRNIDRLTCIAITIKLTGLCTKQKNLMVVCKYASPGAMVLHHRPVERLVGHDVARSLTYYRKFCAVH